MCKDLVRKKRMPKKEKELTQDLVFIVKLQFRKPLVKRIYCLLPDVVLHERSSSIIHQKLFSIKGCLQSKVIFHQRLSSIQDHILSNVVLHPRSSSIKGSLPSKVFFHQRLSSIKVSLPPNVVFHQKGVYHQKGVFHQKTSWSF